MKDWFDHWLKGIEKGVMEAPAFWAYLQDSHLPDPNPSERPGRWVSESKWASRNISSKTFGFDQGFSLEGQSGSGTVNRYSPTTVGLLTGEYMPISGVAELPQDQRSDDALSMCFDTEPLQETLHLLGTSNVNLRVSSDCSCGLIVARLCDLAPNGASTLITFGVLNLKQSKGREKLTPVIPGKVMDVVIRLNDTGWALKPGHKSRVALSSNRWPMAWPVAEAAKLTLYLQDCCLNLPVRNIDDDDKIGQRFSPPVFGNLVSHKIISPATGERKILRNVDKDEIIYQVDSNEGEIKFNDIDLIYGSRYSQKYLMIEGDVLSPQIEYEANFSFTRGPWNVETHSKLFVTCDKGHFFLKGSINAL